MGWTGCWQEERGLGSLWRGLAGVSPVSQLLSVYLGIAVLVPAVPWGQHW